jgi:Bacterial Ig domain
LKNRRTWAAMMTVTGLLLLAPAASAATVSVDDDGDDCPAAGFSSVQGAIDAADPGDTVAICPGNYVEGSGAPGTNALTINKDLTLKGAGADDVRIKVKRTAADHNAVPAGQIAAASPALRDGVGNIVTIQGGTATPITVDISGITFDGNKVYVEGGVLWLDAKGSLVRSRVTNTITSDANNADSIPGGYRSSPFGFGVAMATQATSPPPGNAPRPLLIDRSRIDKYNKVGVWVDSATSDTPPLTASGVINQATINASQIIGRNNCPNYVADGMCQSAGQTSVGPTFGQDGLRVTSNSTAAMTNSIVSANMVNGTGAPTRSTNTTPNTTNNANLPLGAGVRLIGAGASTFSKNNIVDNAYGLYNVQADGATANTGTPATAENDWWGLRYTSVTNNTGPAISPAFNPPIPENPVNGTPTAVDPTCVATNATTLPNSDAVDFCPFRNGSQSDPNTGEFSIVDAPLPVNDTPPEVDLLADDTEYDRGETVHLTADATDDFGIKHVTFFNGLQQLSQDSQPPYAHDFVIPNDAPCGSRTFTAVAEDSLGQTESDDVVVDVVGPNSCENPPDAPTIDLNSPPDTIPQDGVEVSATPTVDDSLTVDEVQFFLGTRLVCTDDTGPAYTCLVLANGDEVGSQSLRAVVADSAAQTAEDSESVTVEKFDPDGISIEMDKLRLNNKKVQRTISGDLDLPDRVEPEDGCDSGIVQLVVERNNETLFPSSQVALQDDCSYELQFLIKEGRRSKPRYDVSSTFLGNEVLNQISNSGRFH